MALIFTNLIYYLLILYKNLRTPWDSIYISCTTPWPRAPKYWEILGFLWKLKERPQVSDGCELEA